MLFSPLEQFEITPQVYVFKSWLGLVLTNSFFFVLMTFILIALWIYSSLNELLIIPKVYAYVLENLLVFIRNLIIENLGVKFLYYFNYIFLLFFFLLMVNLFGMIPYTFTVTSHLVFTFSLSFLSFVAINILGILKHGTNFLSLFLPNGAPLVIAPFLILIELISYIARVFSLAIRLFANIMSGHTLLKILSSFGWNMVCLGSIWLMTALIPVLIIIMVSGLEIAIACLQAYVFTILILIYLNDVIHLH